MRGAHLIDVFQFVDDLIYYRVCSLHFHFRVRALSLDPIAHDTEGVAVKKAERSLSINIIYPSVKLKCEYQWQKVTLGSSVDYFTLIYYSSTLLHFTFQILSTTFV